jgi:hypothetical protein
VVVLRTGAPKVRLQQQFQLRWNDVCVSPCGIPVDPAGTYRVGGGSYRASDPFRMPRPSGQVVLDAHMGSNVKHWIGFGLGLGGGIAALLGVTLLSLAPSATGTSVTGSGLSEKETFQVYGAVYLVTGIILLAVGIPMLASSGTSVDVR